MISAKEMSDPEVQALTIMRYLAKFQKLPEQNERPHIRIIDVNNVQANKPVSAIVPYYIDDQCYLLVLSRVQSNDCVYYRQTIIVLYNCTLL